MDESTFDQIGREELQYLEDQLSEVDPDEVDIVVTDGVLTLGLSDGVRVVINTHRAARQIWMAAVASAWHFDPPPANNPEAGWRTPKGEELRDTLGGVLKDRIGLQISL